jgi:DNA-binding transcriptional LysR family regulator
MEDLPDWVTLRIYLAAIELGSIRQAADRCGIAVAAAAKRIQTLESDSGLALFERGARGVRPTAAGNALAQHARALFDLADRLTADIHGFASGSLGKVRLSVTSSALARAELADALASFATGRPDIEVDLREDTSLPILQDILEGHTDLGIITLETRMPAGLEQHLWLEDRLLAVLAASHPLATRSSLSFGEVMDYPVIGPQEGTALSLLLDEAARDLGRQLVFQLRTANTDGTRRLVAAGRAITIMPDGVVQPYETSLGLRGIPLTEPWSRRRLQLVSRIAASLPPPARLLRDHMLHSASGARS